jgi:hypothetical protein
MRTEFVQPRRIGRPGRLQNVKQALAYPAGIPKNFHNPFSKKTSCFENGEFPMRLGQAIFFGSAAALLTLAAPTLARNSSAHSHATKATEAPAASSCEAYQQAADGSWTQRPCQEMGSKAPQSKSASKPATEETQ